MESWVLLLLLLPLGWISAVAAGAPSNSFFYQCNATRIRLSMKSDPLGSGALLQPQDLTLGQCHFSSITGLQGYIVFEYDLTDCGFSRLTSGTMVESFANLAYSPRATSPGSRWFATAFSERINCTTYGSPVSTQSPIYPVVTQISGSGVLNFHATLMNADFTSPSDLRLFPLGSNIYIEFSVQTAFHQPMQLYVDECTAAPSPNLESTTVKYSIIKNHGCLVDGQVADSMFVARPSPSRIRLTLQVFRFAAVNTNVYLHFQLLVWDPHVLSGPTRKACSFYKDTNSWVLLDDPSSSSICACCESVCPLLGSSRFGRDLEGVEARTVRIGPLHVYRTESGSFEWDTNRSLAIRMSKVERSVKMPPALGALLMEVAVVVLLSLGVYLYNQQGKACAGLVDAKEEIETTRRVLDEEKSDS